jgi:hypothetical protein
VTAATGDVHAPAERRHPVAQAGQAAAARPGARTAGPVVAHLDLARAAIGPDRAEPHPHPHLAGPGVLGHVGERLGAEEVHARLDRGREPARGHLDLDRNRRPDGQGADGGSQAALGEDRGQDPGRELAQVVEAVPGVGQGQADQFPRALRHRIPRPRPNAGTAATASRSP